jgi:hypothetical protein
MPPQKVLVDRQFFAIVREEAHERPMHTLSRELHTGYVPYDVVSRLLGILWRNTP